MNLVVVVEFNLDSLVLSSEGSVQAACQQDGHKLNGSQSDSNSGQNQRLGSQKGRQLREATLRIGMLPGALIGSNRQLVAAGLWHGVVLENRFPILRSVYAAALHLRLDQIPGFLCRQAVRVVVQRFVEALLQDAAQFLVLVVAGDADADLRQEDQPEEDGERNNHAGTLLGSTTASKAGNHEDDGSNHDEHYRCCPEAFTEEIGVVMIG